MSKTNYWRCVQLGVTGKNTSTCFPAAIDKLLPHRRVTPDYYEHYDTAMQDLSSLPKRQWNPLFAGLFRELEDLLDADPFSYVRVRSRLELIELVRTSLREEKIVILDLTVDEKTTHGVGAELVDARRGWYRLQSTNIPPVLRGLVTMGYVFDELHQSHEPPRIRYPFNDTNVTIIAA